jgi:hypothetical protein
MSAPFIASDGRAVEKNAPRGFFALKLPSGIKINECSYHEEANGTRWVGLPGRPQLDTEGKHRTDPTTGRKLYVPIVEIVGAESRRRFKEAALDAVDRLLGKGGAP